MPIELLEEITPAIAATRETQKRRSKAVPTGKSRKTNTRRASVPSRASRRRNLVQTGRN